MERVGYLNSLLEKIKTKTSTKEESNPLKFINILQKTVEYKIPYELMARLKYQDLLTLIIEMDIRKVEQLTRESKIQSNEIEVTPEMAARILKS